MGKPIRKRQGEEWKIIKFESPRKMYAVSTLGRIASYDTSVYDDGSEVKINTYTIPPQFQPRTGTNDEGKRPIKTFKVHRLVATTFLTPPSKKHLFVVHLNNNPLDNRVANLKWVTREELNERRRGKSKKVATKKK